MHIYIQNVAKIKEERRAEDRQRKRKREGRGRRYKETEDRESTYKQGSNFI